jgi:hypothetical protein
MITATAKQRGYIHALAGKAGLDEDMRRDFLQTHAGVRSVTKLTINQAINVIDRLKKLAGEPGAVAGLDNPVGRKLRALWIAASDLGLLADRTDKAMLTFLERQTGVSHTRFFTEPGQATAAIEALKDWLTRGGKVRWPHERDAEPNALKQAVVEAQWLRLVEIGAVQPFMTSNPLLDLQSYSYRVTGKGHYSYFTSADYAKLQNALGRKLRSALATKTLEASR